jgi:hypothetical protein
MSSTTNDSAFFKRKRRTYSRPSLSIFIFILYLCYTTQVLSFTLGPKRVISRKVSPFDAQCSSSSSFSCLTLHQNRRDADDKVDMAGQKGMKGYYRRPSRAIEKGGGFFVPGLEDEKIRFVSAFSIVVLFALNRSGAQVISYSQLLSEVVGLVMAFVLFLQGAQEMFGFELPIGGNTDGSDVSGSNTLNNDMGDVLSVISQPSSSASSLSSVTLLAFDKIARSIVETCFGIRYVCVIDNNNVIYEIGPVTMSNGISFRDTRILSQIAQAGGVTKGLNKDSFLDTITSNTNIAKKELLRHLPQQINSFSLRTDAYNRLWLFGSYEKATSLLDNSAWIDALLEAPVEYNK